MNILQKFFDAWKIDELRKRILWTLALVLIYRIGAHILIPGLNWNVVENLRRGMEQQQGASRWLWGMVQLFSGGAISNLSLLSLGIIPYITSSIIMSLLTKIVPTLEAIAKEGAAGYRKINQYTRLLTVPVAVVQGIFALQNLAGFGAIDSEAGFVAKMCVLFGLIAGATFSMWLGEQITEFGIGNGASILIMCGILARMPAIVLDMWERRKTDPEITYAILAVFGVYTVMIVAIVFITQAQRRIPITHPKHFRGRRVLMGSRNYLPVKVNTAGVMPVIFASSMMIVPALISRIPVFEGVSEELRPGKFLYTFLDLGMILFFSYFWTYLFFAPKEIANNLQERGAFVPGVRPGENTIQYLDFVISRITLVGAVFLCLVSTLPDWVSAVVGLDRYLVAFVGGTGILIVVGVCIDVLQKMDSYLLMHHYDGFGGGGSPIRGRR